MKQKREKGITLIALVITIIILLILAGISIATLTGENGILNKAETAKQETTKQGAKEKVQVEVMGSYGSNGKLNLEELNNNLKNNIADLIYKGKPIANDNKIEDLPAIVVVDGYNVKIHENGNVTLEGEETGGNTSGGEDTPNPPTPVEPEKTKTVEEAKKENKPLSTTENTTIIDEFGNNIIVPAGFKINSESANNVTGGVVIEDVSHESTAGSEFVWIPVGKIYTDEAKTESKAKTIDLSRYTFANASQAQPTKHEEKVIPIDIGNEFNWGSSYISNFEELSKSNLGNKVALNIEEFKMKTNQNHGYYIGRYESRTATKQERTETNKSDGAQVVVRKDDYIYNWVTEQEALKLSQDMYNADSNFTSDLINSYAWDTAIMFLQTFNNRIDKTKPYSRLNSLNMSLASQGTNHLEEINQDKICNVWDMASNTVEWTTETSSRSGAPCVRRGGLYNSKYHKLYYAAVRDDGAVTDSLKNITFRTILYI